MSSKKNQTLHKTFSKFNKLKSQKKTSIKGGAQDKKKSQPTIYSSLPDIEPMNITKKDGVKIHGNFISRPRWASTSDSEKRPLGTRTIRDNKPQIQNEKRPLGTGSRREETKVEHEGNDSGTPEKDIDLEIEKINYSPRNKDIDQSGQTDKDKTTETQDNKEDTKKKTTNNKHVTKPIILEETIIDNEHLIEPKDKPLISEGENIASLDAGKTNILTTGHKPDKLIAPSTKQLPEAEPQHKLTEKSEDAENVNEEDKSTENAEPRNLVAVEIEEQNPHNQEKKETQKTKQKENKSHNHKYLPMSRKGTVIFVLFVLLWSAISMVASQFILSIFMQMILQDKFTTTPLWTAVYDALVFILTLFLVILVPPKLVVSYRKTQAERRQKVDKNQDKKQKEKNINTADVVDANYQLANLLFKPDTKQVDLHNSVTKVERQNEEVVTDSIKKDLSTNRQELGLQGLPDFVDLGLAPIGYAIYLALASIFSSIMSMLFTWFNTNEPQDVGFSRYISGADRIVAIIAIVFLAPIAEEIIFRGWVYGKLRSRIRLPLAILLTSLLFALLHGQWNVGVSVFALSLVLCGLREVTGTIWSGIILHMLSNGIAFYLLYVAMV